MTTNRERLTEAIDAFHVSLTEAIAVAEDGGASMSEYKGYKVLARALERLELLGREPGERRQQCKGFQRELFGIRRKLNQAEGFLAGYPPAPLVFDAKCRNAWAIYCAKAVMHDAGPAISPPPPRRIAPVPQGA